MAAGNMEPLPSRELSLPREAYALLAQANLLRMRGRWEEAVEKCMAALRLAPENSSAQSLLGDIYENQGRYDDAIQWYRMALDIQPDSPADKMKLNRLLEAAHPHAREPLRADLPIVPRPLPSAPAAPPFAAPDQLLRGVTWLAGLLFLLVVILGGIVMWSHRPRPVPITAPSVVLSTPTSSSPGSSAPPPASSVTPTPAAPAQTPSQTPSAAPSSPTPSSVPADADPAETTLLQALQQDAPLTTQGLTPVGVQIDPRSNVITLTVVCPDTPADGSLREALLRAAALTASAAGAAEGSAYSAWTVRCLLPAPASSAPSSQPELALVADTTTSSLASVGTNPLVLSGPQLLPAFHNVWWAPAVTQ